MCLLTTVACTVHQPYRQQSHNLTDAASSTPAASTPLAAHRDVLTMQATAYATWEPAAFGSGPRQQPHSLSLSEDSTSKFTI